MELSISAHVANSSLSSRKYSQIVEKKCSYTGNLTIRIDESCFRSWTALHSRTPSCRSSNMSTSLKSYSTRGHCIMKFHLTTWNIKRQYFVLGYICFYIFFPSFDFFNSSRKRRKLEKKSSTLKDVLDDETSCHL